MTVPGCLAILAIAILGTVMRVVALVWLWEWFITPFGVTSISLLWAFGLTLLWRLFSPSSDGTPDTATKTTTDLGEFAANLTMRVVGVPTTTLIVGYFLHVSM